MTDSQRSRTTDQKLELFRDCFTGLRDVYGTYDPKTGRVRQVKQTVTDRVILHHLQGHQPYGVYLLVGERTRAVAADFDEDNPEPPLEFIRQANHYGIRAYLERSKRKGWHAWIFTELPDVSAAKMRSVVKLILDDIGTPMTEVFPKQDKLAGNTCYGNFINAPLYGSLVFRGRTVFVDPGNGLKPQPDQWAVLESVQRVSERELDEIIEINGLTTPTGNTPVSSPSLQPAVVQGTFGLPPCAQRMLAEGVIENQRVACFRMAVHLKKAGIPRDIAIAALTVWAAKNRPTDGRQIITKGEIVGQTTGAYSKPYRGCGCEEPAVAPYCNPNCPLKAHPRPSSTPNDGDNPSPESNRRSRAAES